MDVVELAKWMRENGVKRAKVGDIEVEIDLKWHPEEAVEHVEMSAEERENRRKNAAKRLQFGAVRL